MGFRSKTWFCAICLVLAASAFSFAADDIVEHDNSRIAIFFQPAISFLSFEEREYFQDAIDTIYHEFRANARNEEESLYVAKQNFQKVNFCFPITGGLQFQVLQDHFLSAGLGFIYDNESVVLTDRKNKSHNYSYTIQGIPFFLEYRFAIPVNLITLSNGGLFSVAFRWYWTLPGTEIYTSWGKIDAENSPFGAGFGFSIGYLIASWKGLNVFGDIGFSSIKVKSKESFADIVPGGSTEKAKWNIGGLQLQIRVSFGVWNKPKPVEKDDDDDVKDSDFEPNPAGGTAASKAAPADSVKAKADSTKVPAGATDSTAAKAAVTDSAAVMDSSAVDSIAADSAAAVKDSAAITDSTAAKNSTAKNDAAVKNSAATAKESEKAPAKKEQPVKEATGSKKPEE